MLNFVFWYWKDGCGRVLNMCTGVLDVRLTKWLWIVNLKSDHSQLWWALNLMNLTEHSTTGCGIRIVVMQIVKVGVMCWTCHITASFDELALLRSHNRSARRSFDQNLGRGWQTEVVKVVVMCCPIHITASFDELDLCLYQQSEPKAKELVQYFISSSLLTSLCLCMIMIMPCTLIYLDCWVASNEKLIFA